MYTKLGLLALLASIAVAAPRRDAHSPDDREWAQFNQETEQLRSRLNRFETSVHLASAPPAENYMDNFKAINMYFDKLEGVFESVVAMSAAESKTTMATKTKPKATATIGAKSKDHKHKKGKASKVDERSMLRPDNDSRNDSDDFPRYKDDLYGDGLMSVPTIRSVPENVAAAAGKRNFAAAGATTTPSPM